MEMKFKIQPYKHQLEALELSKDFRDIGLLWGLGCLVGYSKIHVCYDRCTLGAIKMSEVYDNIKSGEWDISKLRIRSNKGESNGLNNVMAIFPTGTKQVYRMVLENGKSVTGTADHKVLTDDGWVKLKDCLGKQVAIDIPKISSVGYSTCCSIIPRGEAQTYDISMEDPYNNYIANGIVVHNSGKSCGAINILRWKYMQSMRLMRTLILSPSVTLYNWANEFGLHSALKEKDIVVVAGSKSKKMKQLDRLVDHSTGMVSNGKVVIVNYEALLSSYLFDILAKWNPEILVCDEAHYIKNYKAQRSKLVTRLADTAQHRIIMTGTPILKNIQDVFMQFRVLDCGATFGKKFFHFQRKYMWDANGAWSHSQQHFPKWELRDDMVEEINSKIYSKCTRVVTTDCIDLPPLIKMERQLDMTPTQSRLYKEMKRDLITYIKDNSGKASPIIAQAAVVKALRLMQITSGFATTDTGELVTIDNDPKVKETKEILEQVSSEHKTIIWCAFKHNYVQYAELCESLGLKYVMLTGQQSTSQKQDAMITFQDDPDCRVIIANRRAGGIGVNLTKASYSVVVSRNFSLADELQSEARNYRGGSQIHERITKIDLVMKGTIEEDVLASLKDKKEIGDRVLDFITKE